jgi:hydrogenase assembly chaperone HypC/HupF
MCLVLPSRVVAVLGATVEVELADGQRAQADASLFREPDLNVGDFVLVDRGIVVETVTSEEAQTILEMYREIGELLDAEDALA